MNAAAGLRDRFSHWREWEPNPIVVKELRQAVRSAALPAMLIVFPSVLFFTALCFMLGQAATFGTSPSMGSDLFVAFAAVLAVLSMLFIPFYVGGRMGVERSAGNVDLLYVSTLTPGQIIRGKILCGWYLAVLFFSASMPFMAFTSLLRGIDLPSIFFVLLWLFLLVCASVPIAIFLVCLPASQVFRLLLVVCAVPILYSSLSLFLSPGSNLIRSGIGAQMGTAMFWIGFLRSLLSPLATLVLLYFSSVALISPASANRALPLRICVTVVWAVRLVLNAVGTVTSGRLMVASALSGMPVGRLMAAPGLLGMPFGRVPTMTFAVAGSVFSVSALANSIPVLLAVSLLVVISNEDHLSRRVRRAIPTGRRKRLLAFLFYNGAAGGLVWLMLLAAATFLSILLFHPEPASGFSSYSTPFWTPELYNGAFYLYIFAYGLTGLAIHRRIFPRRPAKLAGLIAVFIPVGLVILPLIVRFLFNRLSWTSLESMQPGNLFNLMNHADEQSALENHLICALAWFTVAAVFNRKWFGEQARQFIPLERADSKPLGAMKPVSDHLNGTFPAC